MENYQLIIDIIGNTDTEGTNDKIEEPYSILFNILECYKTDFIKKLITKDININDIKRIVTKKLTTIDNIEIHKSGFKLRLFLNKYLNFDIKYIKSYNTYDIDVELIKINEKNVGVKLNGYFYLDNNYLLQDKNAELLIVDKKRVGEWCKECMSNIIKYNVLKNNELVYFNNIILNYENYFKKHTKETNLDILPYINLYNCLILRYDIHMKDRININKVVTFLPVSRYTCKNLFLKYQNIFKIFTDYKDEKLITFKNPKNDKYFNDGEPVNLVDTKFCLSLRLYCSKVNNIESVYFRKTTEKLDLEIKFIVKKSRIIGVRFGEIDYYIWKNEGNLNEYELYKQNGENHHEFIVNIFKDACIFYFKLN
jgi:hypothetical protein